MICSKCRDPLGIDELAYDNGDHWDCIPKTRRIQITEERGAQSHKRKITNIVEILSMRGHDFLWIDTELWMWDIPNEHEAQKGLSDQASGDVLCVGYGLGLIQGYLLENEAVNSVTTIEKYECVIDANIRRYPKPIKGNIIIANFLRFSEQEHRRRYDYVIADICADIMPKYLPDYTWFRQKSEKFLKPGGIFLSWCSDYFEYLIETQDQSHRYLEQFKDY